MFYNKIEIFLRFNKRYNFKEDYSRPGFYPLAIKMKNYLLILFLIQLSVSAKAAGPIQSSQDSTVVNEANPDLFYENLRDKAFQNGLTRLFYKAVVNLGGEVNLQEQYQDLQKLQGKIITSVKFKELDVFGPTFEDTARVSKTKLGEWGNKLHTKTNQNIIRKNVLFSPGDTLDADRLLENERIIRNLPYIKDARFAVIQNPVDTNEVELLVLTKDVFSFGIDVDFKGAKSASVEMYNQNILGIGHQISAKIVGNTYEDPYVGVETFYTINNIGGNFVNLSLGYVNTYLKEGIQFDFDKEFLLYTTKWAGGLSYYRLYRSDRLNGGDPLRVDQLNFRTIDGWAGHAFELNKNNPSKNVQLVVSGRVRHLKYYERPEPGADDKQYFTNSNLYLGSISLSRRNYVRDQLVYSYGITEDIPKGYLHEWVVGYEKNEFIKRWYSHLYFSSGNFLPNKAGYLFSSFGIGGFFNVRHFEQGQSEFKVNYISPLFRIGSQQLRQFIGVKYLYGINRFDQEELYLNNSSGIRGFSSKNVAGKQRLSLTLESVFFQRWNLLDFNFAFFGFGDLGFVGPENETIYKQKLYSGLGVGVRIRNENLVFNTLQLRLAFYPSPPSDMENIAVTLAERGRSSFYSFQAREPEAYIFY